MRIEVPPGECRTAYNGYPWSQIAEIFPEKTRLLLAEFMYGQTMMVCDETSECDQAHGPAVYWWDFWDFLEGRISRD